MGPVCEEYSTLRKPSKTASLARDLGIRFVALLLSFSACTAELEIAIRPGSETGGLNVRSPHCPGDVFDFRTCEGVVVGSKDFGLFQVILPATFGDGNQSLRRDAKVWRYSWPYTQGVTVYIEVEPDGDSLKLKYTLQNTSTSALDAVQLHTCIPTTEAPGFFPHAHRAQCAGQLAGTLRPCACLAGGSPLHVR